MGRQQGLPSFFKKSIDKAVALCVLGATAPILGAAAVATRMTIGSPAFFTQLRPGLHGRPFKIYKLRTMSNSRGPDGELLPDEARLTVLGRFLRSTSIDELPQMWNVLKGDLSLVGPRPLMMDYLPLYDQDQARRHSVMPGITGWAQINGRNALSWDEKFSLDVWYVDHWSLWLDLRILIRTARGVLLREGISQAGHVTMPPFKGRNDV
ncbi:MAG: sugar transferase [Labilithrix sp.]